VISFCYGYALKDSLYNAEAAQSSIVKDTAVGIRVHEITIAWLAPTLGLVEQS
jgi:hypothetical protein